MEIKVSLMDYWTSLIILKEILKPSDKFLRVWAKSQLRFLRKLLNLHRKISMENWCFTHFLSDLPRPLSFYTALENNSIFYNNFFVWGGVGGSFTLPPPPAGAPVLWLKLSLKYLYKRGNSISYRVYEKTFIF